MRMRRPDPKREAELVELWNKLHPVGSRVSVRLDDGTIKHTRTTAAAEVLGGHTAVIWLEGISGCYRLDRCTVVKEAA